MEFVIFGLTLLGVALFHRRALTVAFAETRFDDLRASH